MPSAVAAADGRADMKNLLGGKGANLAEMSNLGLSVPPGFTITTEACTWFFKNNETYPPELKPAVEAALARVSEIAGARLGDPRTPVARVRALGRARFHARHDGYGAQSRPQRRNRRGAGAADRRPTLCLRLLSALHSHVRQCRARSCPTSSSRKFSNWKRRRRASNWIRTSMPPISSGLRNTIAT